MGAFGGDRHGEEHWTPNGSGTALVLADTAPRFEAGNAGISVQFASVSGQDLLDLHAAAVTSDAAFAAKAAAVWGSTWTSCVSACDNAGLTGLYHVKGCLAAVFRAALTRS